MPLPILRDILQISSKGLYFGFVNYNTKTHFFIKSCYNWQTDASQQLNSSKFYSLNKYVKVKAVITPKYYKGSSKGIGTGY
jgi:hypothetical protein